MRHIILSVLLIPMFLFVASCGRDDPVTAPVVPSGDLKSLSVAPEILAGEIIAASGWIGDPATELPAELNLPDDKSGRRHLVEVERLPVVGDVVLYNYLVAVGPGAYDVIGLHRVVRESRPHRPIKAHLNVFLDHGGGKDFIGNFLPGFASPELPDDFGFAVHLAQNDVDVWGLDHGYTLLPWDPGMDYAFTLDWGFQRFVDEDAIGIAVARFVRRYTGSGGGRMIMGGYSSGGVAGYALLSAETQLPPGQRDVGAFICFDYGMIFTNRADAACAEAEYYAGLIDAGIYADQNFFPLLGIPARDDPDGPSPFFPGFTNLQALLTLGSSPSEPYGPAHFWAGVFDENGIAVDLQYTSLDQIVEFWVNSPEVAMSFAAILDGAEMWCGTVDHPWDDHLDEVAVPVLSIGAMGGFANPDQYGDITLDVLGSADKTQIIVSLHPPDEIALDFAHVDLFTADNARDLIWQPALEWIRDHAGPPR